MRLRPARLIAGIAVLGLVGGCAAPAHGTAGGARRAPVEACEPLPAYLFPGVRGDNALESAAWRELDFDSGGYIARAVVADRLVEAVVAGGPTWSVEDLRLTEGSAARVRRFLRGQRDPYQPLAAQACFLGRTLVQLGRIAPAAGRGALRASQLLTGIEFAAPAVVAPGGRFVVALSRGWQL